MGRKYGYYPESDPEQVFLIDSGLDGISDLLTKYMKLASISDEEKKKEAFG